MSYLGTANNIKPFIATHCEFLSSAFGDAPLSIGSVKHDGEVWHMFCDWLRKEKKLILYPTSKEQQQIDSDLEYNREYIARLEKRKALKKQKEIEEAVGIF